MGCVEVTTPPVKLWQEPSTQSATVSAAVRVTVLVTTLSHQVEPSCKLVLSSAGSSLKQSTLNIRRL